jgi:hypothetical protein
MRNNKKTYAMIGALVAAALTAGIAVTFALNNGVNNATAVSIPRKDIVITDQNMPKTPEIEIKVAKMENGVEIPRPDIGGYHVKAGSDSIFGIRLVSHDTRDFSPILRVYNANNRTAESAAFAKVPFTDANKGFPPGLTANLLLDGTDQLPLKANSQALTTMLLHTTSQLAPDQYQIAVATEVDQDVDGQPIVSHVRGEIIATEVI